MAYPSALEFALKFHFLEVMAHPIGLAFNVALSIAIGALVVWRRKRWAKPDRLWSNAVLAWLPLAYTLGSLGLLAWLGNDPSSPDGQMLRYASVPALYLGMFALTPLIVLAALGSALAIQARFAGTRG